MAPSEAVIKLRRCISEYKVYWRAKMKTIGCHLINRIDKTGYGLGHTGPLVIRIGALAFADHSPRNRPLPINGKSKQIARSPSKTSVVT